jgi:ATP-dependent HslUV protease, peptidase subunit HslV
MGQAGGSMFKGTTILTVRDAGAVVVAGDGQVSMGNTIVKAHARKVRRLADDRVIAGFAGSTADAMTLFEKLEGKLKEYNSKLMRAAVELAKEWRTDRYLRRLEAMLIAADAEKTLMLSGTGDVIEPDEGIAAIGSGSGFALAAARALARSTDLGAEEITRRAMGIAAEICVFTNDSLVLERIAL